MFSFPVTGKIEVAVVKPSKPESASLSQVMAASDEATCFNFSVGNPHKREFYSPNYPGHYPKNTKCTLRITADVGHIVKVDFRDHFRLEQSPNKCEYDRLEIRDGAYGYSPEITNSPFCGSEFPKGSPFQSTRRHMWLQFSSDDSIEYEGFRAVYDFIPVANQGEARTLKIEIKNSPYCGSEFPRVPFQSTRRHMWLQFSSDDSIEYEGFRAVYDFIPVANQAQNGHTDIECTFYRTGSSGLIEKTEIEHLWNKYRQEDTFECMWTIETEADKKVCLFSLKVLTT
ncbi:hypothetical protein JTE90_015926 [Oedothorax gibbosus]|uniref:CUB domain-containing protein n=1 Tax=Oedothorax gibbosus TaxID=931172 RepID=A0AAV6TZE5_9ARAC|nr:hypothetical protein JTE90_015926 [Oedothorax gibbosus]